MDEQKKFMMSSPTAKKSKTSPKSPTKLLMPSLPTIEISFYTAAWIGGILFSGYHVYLASKREQKVHL